MSITLKKFTKDAQTRHKLKSLYNSAFPAEERAPFFLAMAKARRGKAEMLTAFDGDEFVGFAYMVSYKDMAYLFYLAVDEAKRGQGYGGQILDELKIMYRDIRIFLAHEELTQECKNYEQRKNRHNFYIRNGFQDYPLQITEAGVIYDVMGIGGKISSAEYDALITSWCGRIYKKMFSMRLIEKNY